MISTKTNLSTPAPRTENIKSTAFNYSNSLRQIEFNVEPKGAVLVNNIITFDKDFAKRDFILGEGTSFIGWKLISNVSAQILEFNEEIVTVECLIDVDNKIYEEAGFRRSLFTNIELSKGKKIKVCMYSKPNSEMIEIVDKPNLVPDTHFPTPNFEEKFKSFPLSNVAK